MGDPNASIPTPQPVYMRPMFASLGKAAATSSIAFVSQRCINSGTAASYGLGELRLLSSRLSRFMSLQSNFHSHIAGKQVYAVRKTRSLGKKDMVLNDATPIISVDPETYRVEADGVHLTCQPSVTLPLSQRYYLF